MPVSTKTIGPMTRNNCSAWSLGGTAIICSYALSCSFNVPYSATKLWVTLTKTRPLNNKDAMRLRSSKFYGRYHLDNKCGDGIYLLDHARALLRDFGFGNDFWATIYYE